MCSSQSELSKCLDCALRLSGHCEPWHPQQVSGFFHASKQHVWTVHRKQHVWTVHRVMQLTVNHVHLQPFLSSLQQTQTICLSQRLTCPHGRLAQACAAPPHVSAIILQKHQSVSIAPVQPRIMRITYSPPSVSTKKVKSTAFNQ